MTTSERRRSENVEGDSILRRIRAGGVTRLFYTQAMLMFLALLVIVGIFAILAPNTFAQSSNLRLIAQNASIFLVLAVGSTFVIVTAGIDLSVGSVLVFSSVAASTAMRDVGGDGWGAALVGLAAALLSGLAWGLLNGLLVGIAKVPSLIVTLGTMGIALGLALVWTGGDDIRGVPSVLEDVVGFGNVAFNIPVLVVIAGIVAVGGTILLDRTRFGLYTRAIGSNAASAKLTGVSTRAHLVKVYALAGLCAGFAGFLSVAQFSTTGVAGHSQDALLVITAIILGGTSLFGGFGTVFGTVVGILIPATLQNGFIILGVEPFWQPVAIGAILILAVYIDQVRRSKMSLA